MARIEEAPLQRAYPGASQLALQRALNVVQNFWIAAIEVEDGFAYRLAGAVAQAGQGFAFGNGNPAFAVDDPQADRRFCDGLGAVRQ